MMIRRNDFCRAWESPGLRDARRALSLLVATLAGTTLFAQGCSSGGDGGGNGGGNDAGGGNRDGGGAMGLCVASQRGCPTCTQVGVSDPACAMETNCCGSGALKFCTDLTVAACIPCTSTADCQTGATCCTAGDSPDGGTMPDPCGVAGRWVIHCPQIQGPVCTSCTAGTLAAADYFFTVPPAVAAAGGAWTESGAHWGGTKFSLDLATCTVSQNRGDSACSSSGVCCNSASYVHKLKAAGGASVVYTVICTMNQTTCVCAADFTCTEAKQ